MVEYERLGGKKMKKGGRMSEDIGWPPSWVTQRMVGSHFLLPVSENVERGWEKRFSEWWLDLLAFFGVPAAGQPGVPTAVPPWPWGTRALGQREILASRLRKAATKLAENSSQFAVWSLNVVISSLIFFFFSESKEKKIILLLIFTLKILCLFSYT